MKRWTVIWLCVCLLLCGCEVEPAPLTRSTFALDTYCTVTVYDGNETVLSECIRHIAAREALWSKTIASSDVARLNADGTATVDAETAALLSAATTLCEMTDGSFDVTTAALTQVWIEAERQGVLPSEASLAAALDTVGGKNVKVDGTTVTLRNGASVDFGGIAKGYIADELAVILRNGGCGSALIDLGGNIVAVGRKTDGQAFHVGIAHPTDDGALAATVAVTDRAVVTSGSYERGFTIGDTRFSHIIDPQTGRPVDNELLSVTIIAPSAATADALSTACFVAGYDRALRMLSRFDDVEAVFVLRGGEVKTTDGVTLV